MVIWLIGLAGVGKTSIGKALSAKLKESRSSTVFIDGDDVRQIMGGDLGYALEDRRKNGWRICRLCNYLDQQGIDVVCATLSQFHEQQSWNRRDESQEIEHAEPPRSLLIRRHPKPLSPVKVH